MLTPEQVQIYAPQLGGAALDSAIAYAQMLIEGPFGANRPIGISKFTDVRDLSMDGRCFLSTFPILPNSVEHPWQAKIRGGNAEGYGITSRSIGWQDLTTEEFDVDFDTGEVQVSGGCFVAIAPYGLERRRQPMQPIKTRQLKISYYSGLDFSVAELTPELAALRNAMIQIVLYSTSQESQGIKSLKVDREYSVEYRSASSSPSGRSRRIGSTGSDQLDLLLSAFHKYRPKSYAI